MTRGFIDLHSHWVAGVDDGARTVEESLALMPELEPLLDRKVGLMSGGEQQMLTLARALAGSPKVLLADELTLGLAPLIVARLLGSLREAAERGVGVLIVEERVKRAYALRRIGEPDDVANAVVFLASAASRHITGQVVSVNGGYACLG